MGYPSVPVIVPADQVKSFKQYLGADNTTTRLMFSYLLGLLLTPAGGLYALLITAFLVVLNASKKHLYAFALLALPGVLHHELLHFVVGLVLFARPTGISIIPKRVEGGYLLGSVMLNNVRWYNAVFVGLAPLLLLPAAVYVAFFRIEHLQYGVHVSELTWAYFATSSLINASLPSVQDTRAAIRSRPLIAGFATH